MPSLLVGGTFDSAKIPGSNCKGTPHRESDSQHAQHTPKPPEDARGDRGQATGRGGREKGERPVVTTLGEHTGWPGAKE